MAWWGSLIQAMELGNDEQLATVSHLSSACEITCSLNVKSDGLQPSSFLLLVVLLVTSSVLAPSSDARSYY